MSGLMPDATLGYVPVTDGAGNAILPVPQAGLFSDNGTTFRVVGGLSYLYVSSLTDNCGGRVAARQVNFIESELLALAARVNPTGSWTPAAGNNLAAAFTAGVPILDATGHIPLAQIPTALQGVVATQAPAFTGDMTTTLGSTVTTVGAIGGKAVSLGGALTTSGAFATTLTATGITALTLPTSGTVTALGNAVTGSGSIVLANAGVMISPTLGGNIVVGSGTSFRTQIDMYFDSGQSGTGATHFRAGAGLTEYLTLDATGLKTPLLTGLLKGNGAAVVSAAVAGTDYLNPTSSLATNTGLPLATGVTGTLAAAQVPAFTGDVTNTAGSLTTAVNSIGGKAVVLGGALTTSGAFATTLTATGATTVTLPTSGTLATLGANTFTGQQIVSINGVASTPPILASGTWFTGGTTTTTKPAMLIEPAGTPSTTWNVNGTGLGINAPSGFTGNFFDFQTNGVSKFFMNANGNAVLSGSLIASGSVYVADGNQFIIGNSYDVKLGRRGPWNLQLGPYDAAAPIAQTLTAQSVVAGTTNTAAPNLVVQGSAGTGTGAGGSVKLQTAPAGTTGSSQNAFVDTVVVSPAVVSSAALLMPQPWVVTGGTATTTKPALLIEPAGTVSTGWNTAGTGLGVNAPVGFAGKFVDLQINGSPQLNISSNGSIATNGNISSPNINTVNINVATAGFSQSIWGNANTSLYYLGSSFDTALSRRAAANWQIGQADAAAPVAQTLTAQSVVAGTTNTAGVNFIVQGAAGTGLGNGGSVKLQTAPAGTTGSSQNAFVDSVVVSPAVVSSAALLMPQPWVVTGGTATTTKPAMLIEPAGTVSTSWTPYGTGLGVNAPSGFLGNIADFQVNGVSKVSVRNDGFVCSTSSASFQSGTIQLGFYGPGAVDVVADGGRFALGGSLDTTLTRRAAANWQLGFADAAAPIAQKLTAQSVIAGTTNTAAPNLIVQGSAGTGLGNGGSVKLQTAPAGTTGSSQNAFVDTVVASPAVLSSAALLMPQPWVVSGGTATTTKPAMLIEPAGTASTVWNVNGTGLGVNAPSGFTGNLADFQVGGGSQVRIRNDGFIFSNGIQSSGNIFAFGAVVTLANDGGSFTLGAASDTILTRKAAANWRLGAADIAAPVAQTLTAQSVVAGTSNTAGVNLTVQGSASTGTGVSGDLVLQTGGAGAGATAQNAFATGLVIKGTTQQVVVPANGAASTSPLLQSGTWYTGGTGITTKPAHLIEPSGTVSTGWSTLGTGLGVNASAGFTGNLFDVQVAGVSKFSVSSVGAITGTIAIGSHKYWRLTHMQSGDGTGAQAAAAIGFRATVGGAAQTVTSTSSSPIYGAGYDSTKAQDNDPTTYWNSSVGGTGVYYEAYFATAVAVREIAIMARNDAYASSSSQYFKVWYSDDGLKYTIAAEMLTPTTYTASMVQTFGLPV